MNTQALIDEIISLPVEDRILATETLLISLNQPQSEIDKKWAKVAMARRDEILSGRVQPIDGNQVFKEIWKRLEK